MSHGNVRHVVPQKVKSLVLRALTDEDEEVEYDVIVEKLKDNLYAIGLSDGEFTYTIYCEMPSVDKESVLKCVELNRDFLYNRYSICIKQIVDVLDLVELAAQVQAKLENVF